MNNSSRASTYVKTVYLGLGFLVLIPTLIFLLLAKDVILGNTIFFDAPIARYIVSIGSPVMTEFVRVLTHMGDKLIIGFLGFLIAVILFLRHHRLDAAAVVVVLVGSAAINVALKLMFERARPDSALALIVEDGFSFPSGHAMTAAVFAAIAIYAVRRSRWRGAIFIGMIGYMLLVGFSRIYLGVHYPSDVLAGFCVSIAWAGLAFGIAKYAPIFKKFKAKSESSIK